MTYLSADDFVAVPISSDLYLEIAKRFPGSVSTLIENVVSDFLERTEEDYGLAKKGTEGGVKWEHLILPHGTLIRTRYFGKYLQAEVSEGRLIFEGTEFPSVSKLANKMRGNTSVNAWLYIEIKRPSDADWIVANLLR